MKTIRLKTIFTILINCIIYYPLPAQLNSHPQLPLSSRPGHYTSDKNRMFEEQRYDQIKKTMSLLKDQPLTSVDLISISPGGGDRWRDVAGNLYSDAYRTSYAYNLTGVQVQLSFYTTISAFSGTLTATNLKPNFAYQLKLAGIPGTDGNERIGFTGRWWQEEWDSTSQEWTKGQNLNNKGTGYPPTPNDIDYLSRRDITDQNSPTGKKYRFTGYLPFDFFITDEYGSAVLPLVQNSSFHVFWNTEQRSNDPDNDGPVKQVTFDPDPDQPGSAYATDYGESTMSVFGEWERLPMGGIVLPLGEYTCQFILTEESFHGWPEALYAGNWASAMGADIQFSIIEDNPLPVQLSFFRADLRDTSVVISWSTESELNNTGFEIYRAAGKSDDYHLITSYKTNNDLIGQGNSSYKHAYFFRDILIQPGRMYFYKLADVDFSGVKTFYKPVSVAVPLPPKEFSLKPNYPNPFNPITKIEFHIPQASHVTLKIYDSLGKESAILISAQMAAGIYRYDWDANNLASGIYFIFVKYGDIIKTQKLYSSNKLQEIYHIFLHYRGSRPFICCACQYQRPFEESKICFDVCLLSFKFFIYTVLFENTIPGPHTPFLI